MTLETLFIAATFGVPLVVAALRARTNRVSSNWILGSFVASLIVLIGLLPLELAATASVWPGFRLPSADVLATGVDLAVVTSGPSLVVCLAVLISMCGAVASEASFKAPLPGFSEDDREGVRRRDLIVLGLQGLICLASLATNFIVVLAAWFSIDALIDAGRRPRRQQVDDEPASPLVPLRLAGIVLLAALGWFDARYFETGVAELQLAIGTDQRVDAAVVTSGLVIVLAIALVMRCGQFPAIVWMHRLVSAGKAAGGDQSHRDSLLNPWICCVAVVGSALALIGRLQGLWASHVDAAFLMGALGALTAVVAGFNACLVSQDNTEERDLSWVTACWVLIATIGQAFIGVAATSDRALSFAAQTCIWVMILLSAFAWLSSASVTSLCAQSRSRLRAAAVIVCLMVASGLRCQADALEIAQQQAVWSPEDHTIMGFNRRHAFFGLWLGGTIGQVCVGFALMRVVCLLRNKTVQSAATSSSGVPARLAAMILALTVVWLWLLPLGLQPRFIENALESALPRIVIGAALPAGWLGCLLAWLSWSAMPQLVPLGEKLFGPLLRLARNGWCLESVVLFGCRVPWLGLSHFFEFFDRRLLGGGKEGAWSAPSERAAEFMDEVRATQARYYALAIVGAAAGLLFVIGWGR